MAIVKNGKGRLLFVLERGTCMNYDILAQQDWMEGISNHVTIALDGTNLTRKNRGFSYILLSKGR
jgi:hypothetical protein